MNSLPEVKCVLPHPEPHHTCTLSSDLTVQAKGLLIYAYITINGLTQLALERDFWPSMDPQRCSHTESTT